MHTIILSSCSNYVYFMKKENLKGHMNKTMRILTFDIEEWFHLLDLDTTKGVESWSKFEIRIHKNTERILQLLKTSKQKATFFCLGWVAEKYPEVIREIDNLGYDIGSHTTYHQLAYELTPEKFKEDLKRSINTLENITGKKVTSFRVPGYSITKNNTWALEIIAECGIECDSSIFPAPRGHGGFEDFGSDKPVLIQTPSGNLKEFPINTVSFLGKNIIFSGGGYFRLLPYSLIHLFMNNSKYVMSYFHPRDFDPDQPILKGLSINRRFKSYYGLRSAFSKLEKLLSFFKFTDIPNAKMSIDWTKNIINSNSFNGSI